MGYSLPEELDAIRFPFFSTWTAAEALAEFPTLMLLWFLYCLNLGIHTRSEQTGCVIWKDLWKNLFCLSGRFRTEVVLGWCAHWVPDCRGHQNNAEEWGVRGSGCRTLAFRTFLPLCLRKHSIQKEEPHSIQQPCWGPDWASGLTAPNHVAIFIIICPFWISSLLYFYFLLIS